MTKLATKFKKADDSLGFLLWKLSNQWQARQRAALKEFGLTHVQFALLASLTFMTNKADVTQKQLALYTQIDVMMASEVLRTLEKKELIRREPNAVDARAIFITVTKPGEALANRAVKAVETVDSHFFAVLTTAERNDLLKTTQQLTKSHTARESSPGNRSKNKKAPQK